MRPELIDYTKPGTGLRENIPVMKLPETLNFILRALFFLIFSIRE